MSGFVNSPVLFVVPHCCGLSFIVSVDFDVRDMILPKNLEATKITWSEHTWSGNLSVHGQLMYSGTDIIAGMCVRVC